ncbi:MAG: hypothetical protein OXR64_04570 [Chloroflexota bacterium]|nr:hypothetical protein [Chloroflexota bacterium]MDE2919101.1 hypothetical protein [Chloroflexota bacterium]
MRNPRVVALLLALTLALVIAGCGEDSGDSATAATSPATPAAGDAATAGKLSANNATVEELEAAFAAAGISNPGAWAHDVEHHRPFPADDPDFAKLRRGLADHNAAPEIVETIVGLLKLP